MKLCECGCGQVTAIARQTNRELGHTAGQPVRYRPGHHLKGLHPTRPLAERFWPKVDRNGPIPTACPELGPCWLWTAAVDEHGYGKLSGGGHDGRMLRAHRVSYELRFGPVPPELRVLHRCDNPPCVNPDHLFTGTMAANAADMVARGRSASGERHSQAKLTADQVEEIRRLVAEGQLSQEAIGARFGVRGPAISRIATGKRWGKVAC